MRTAGLNACWETMPVWMGASDGMIEFGNVCYQHGDTFAENDEIHQFLLRQFVTTGIFDDIKYYIISLYWCWAKFFNFSVH